MAIKDNNTNQKASIFANGGRSNQTNNKEDLPQAEYWLNIGYGVAVDVRDEATGQTSTEERFVSLSQGIALDTLPELKANTNSAEFNALQTARNELKEQIMEYITKELKLAPGETYNLDLTVQVRRRNGEAAPIATKDNPYSLKLFAK